MLQNYIIFQNIHRLQLSILEIDSVGVTSALNKCFWAMFCLCPSNCLMESFLLDAHALSLSGGSDWMITLLANYSMASFQSLTFFSWKYNNFERSPHWTSFHCFLINELSFIRGFWSLDEISTGSLPILCTKRSQPWIRVLNKQCKADS